MITKGEWKVDNETIVSPIIDIADMLSNNPDDAHLVSAAPDMYQVLKALINHFRANDENYYKSDLCTDALQALAKAEGK